MKTNRRLLIQCMRVSLLHTLITCLCLSASWAFEVSGQELLDRRVTLDVHDQKIKTVLSTLEKAASVKFSYSPQVVQSHRKLSFQVQNVTLGEVLNTLLPSLNLTYSIIGTQIILRQLASTSSNPTNVNAFLSASLTDPAKAVDQVVSGIVSDETGAGLPGVSVVLKGSQQGTTTDAAGKYRLSVSGEKPTIVFSYVGYVSQEVAVGNRTTLNISLQADTKTLEEVQVTIGYGTTRKSDLTGAVSSVKEAQLLERPAASLTQTLSGRLPGVQVNTNSGRPGGRTTIRIRGFSSINSSNNPLFVVDGVLLPQGNGDQFSSPIDYINPSDIVSVEVLKDASSTAIYGARGANGVILVQTRKGKAGESRVSYDANFSVNTIGPNKPQVLNAKEYLATEDLAYANIKKYDPAGWASGKYSNLDPVVRRTAFSAAHPGVFDANLNPLYDTDWFKESSQNKLSQSHQLGFSGGNERTQYALSLGYRDDEGLIKTSYLKRYSARFSLDDQVKSWLKIGGTLSYNNQTENLVDINDAVARQIVEDFPFLPVKYPGTDTYAENRDYPQAEGTMSSVHRLMDRKYIQKTQTTIGSLFTNITFAKGLEMKTVLGGNIQTQEIDQSQTRTLDIGNSGTAQVNNNRTTFWSLENYLTYNKQINANNAITALLGISWQATDRFGIGAGVRNFSTDYFTFNNLGAGSTLPAVSSFADRTAFNSYFGRVNYSLKDKYLITFTGRADGSSKFGENHKFAFFPSAALAWRVSEESFLKNNPVVSNLKLRTSYGLTGNSEIPAYSSLSLLSSNYAAVYNDAKFGGTGINRLANPDLRWEKTAQYDAGIELGLFKGRVSIEADYYYRLTTDMLLDAPVPRTSGYATIRRNVGSMRNQGFELGLNTVNIDRGGFQWNSTFNVSLNRNRVLSLATPSDIFGVGGPNFINQTNIIRVGESVGSFWGLTRLGTWSEAEREQAAKFTSYRNGLTILPGDLKYLDVNGDNAITDADRRIIGNGSPKYWGAFTNSFRYKNVDLTLELQFSQGNDVLMLNFHPSEDRVSIANSYKSVLNAWTPTNQNTPIAEIRETRAGYVTNVDSHWVLDGSFLRGKNLLLGYTFPAQLTNKLKMNRLRVYTTVQNFFLLVSNKIIGDPEVTPTNQGDGSSAFSQGEIWHNYPKPTTYMVGLQIGL